MFNKAIRTIVSVMLCLSIVAGVSVTVSAKSKNEIKNEISELEKKADKIKDEIKALKAQKAEKAVVQKKLQEQIDNTQQQIAICSKKITQYQNKIDANQNKIDQKNEEKDEIIVLFKKRLRSIYMSNSANNLQVLLGADDFADYLTLAELSKKVSTRDKAMVNEIIDIIDDINEAQESLKSDINAQREVKKVLASKQSSLSAQISEVNTVISGINSDVSALNGEVDEYKKAISALEKELDKFAQQAASSNVKYDGSQFKWPVPGFYMISSYYGQRWGRLHGGIDIAGSGIYGAKIVAAADGQVLTAGWNSGGYGNYVMVNHGTKNGKTYVTLYAHMSSVATSAGATVKKGQVIGYVGSTGRSTGPHLHFEIRVNGSKVNPSSYFNKVK